MPSSIDRLDGTNAVQRTAFLYGPDHARTRQTISPMSGEVAGSPTTTIWYGGAIEKEIDTVANTTTIRTVLPAQLGFIEEKFSGTAPAPTADGARNLRYFLTDHLGSTLAEMDQAQAVLQRMSYDAWGRRRNADGSDDGGPQWGSLKNAQDHSGYTGHEHLDQLGLVNMNARMYDPLLGRHTSADPTVPDPANAQAFNRYSYVLNNALVFTDPTGLAPEERHVNTTSDSICLGRPDCRVIFEPALEEPGQSNGVKTGVAVKEGGVTTTPAASESSPPPPPPRATGAPMTPAQEQTANEPNIRLHGRCDEVCRNEIYSTTEDYKNRNLSKLLEAATYLIFQGIGKIFGPSAETAPPVVGKVPTGDAPKGIPADAKFAQKTYNIKFSDDGAFAGKTVPEVAAALRSGAMKPAQVEVSYVVRDGQTIILNTRSSQALQQAGIPRNQWKGVDRTGDSLYEGLLNGQLRRNPGAPFDNVRPSGSP